MKKIPSVFQRNYETDRLCRDEVVPGCEWVLAGEGVATIKWDGTACMIRDGQLFKRYDRKRTKRPSALSPTYRPAPDGWEACQAPDESSGHWPGWLPVGDGPEDRWFRDALDNMRDTPVPDGTYEACGPKFQGNPHGLPHNMLIRHGEANFCDTLKLRSFDFLRKALTSIAIEGIVFHHPDGRLAKVKRKDFGLPWPVKEKMK